MVKKCFYIFFIGYVYFFIRHLCTGGRKLLRYGSQLLFIHIAQQKACAFFCKRCCSRFSNAAGGLNIPGIEKLMGG